MTVDAWEKIVRLERGELVSVILPDGTEITVYANGRVHTRKEAQKR
jgi:hypothetical protein